MCHTAGESIRALPGNAWHGVVRSVTVRRGGARRDTARHGMDNTKGDMQITIELTGTKSMIMHNGQLANPLNGYTRALKAITGKRKKTDDDLMEIMRIESRASAYETPTGTLGLPTQNVWRCIYDASKSFKLGEDIKRSLISSPVIEPVLFQGSEIDVDIYLKDPDHILYVPVVVQRSRTMRARLIMPEWKTTHTFDLLEDVIDVRNLEPVLNRAGRLQGIGDWRPMYGTFDWKFV